MPSIVDMRVCYNIRRRTSMFTQYTEFKNLLKDFAKSLESIEDKLNDLDDKLDNAIKRNDQKTHFVLPECEACSNDEAWPYFIGNGTMATMNLCRACYEKRRKPNGLLMEY